MNEITTTYEGSLKPFKMRFFMAAALFLAVALAGVSQQRSRLTLEKSRDGLSRAQNGLARVKEANTNRKHALTVLKSQYGEGVKNSSPEMVLYGKIEEIKARLNPDDMTITAVEKKSGEASLQYSLTFRNPDFNTLLNAVSYLHGAVFPLSPVSSVVAAQSEASGAGGISFKVSGRVITIEKTKP